MRRSKHNGYELAIESAEPSGADSSGAMTTPQPVITEATPGLTALVADSMTSGELAGAQPNPVLLDNVSLATTTTETTVGATESTIIIAKSRGPKMTCPRLGRPRSRVSAVVAMAILCIALLVPPATMLVPAASASTKVPPSPPAFASASQVSFTEATQESFVVSVAAEPSKVSFSWSGELPLGVTFLNANDGASAVLSGVPALGSVGTYPITITATDQNGLTSQQSFKLTVVAFPLLEPLVTSISPSAGTAGTAVTLTGRNFTRATEVIIGLGASFTVHSDTSITAIVPSNVASGTFYVHVGGITTPLPSDLFTLEAPPQVPHLVSVAPRGLGALATWAPNPSTDQVTGYTLTSDVAAGYSGAVPTGCAGPHTSSTSGDSTFVVQTGLCPSVPYTFHLTAANAFGTSAPSAPSNPVVPLAIQRPAAPLLVSVLDQTGSLAVAWAPPSDDGGGRVLSYHLYAAPARGPTHELVLPAIDTEATVRDLTNGMSYSVRLTATSDGGTSLAATGSGEPSATLLPGAPASLKVIPGNLGRLLVSWSPPTETGSRTLVGYLLKYWQSSKEPKPVQVKLSAAITSYTIAGLSWKDSYIVSLGAASSLGEGPVITSRTPVVPRIELASSAVELSAATMSSLQSDVESDAGGTLTWPLTPPAQVSALRPGQTLVANATPVAPQGLLAIVQTTTTTASGFVVNTTPAQLSQAYRHIGFSTAGSPPATATSDAPLHARSSGTQHPHLSGCIVGSGSVFCGPFTQDLSLDDNCNPGASWSLCGQAFFTETMFAGVCISITEGCQTPSGGPADGDVYVGAGVTANAQLAFAVQSTNPITNHLTTITILNNTPTGIPGLDMNLTVPINLLSSGHLSVTSQAMATWVGAEDCNTATGCSYQPGLANFTLSAQPVAGSGAAASLTLQAVPTLELTDVVEGSLTIDATLTANVNTSGDGPYFQVCPGFTVNWSADVELLGLGSLIGSLVGPLSGQIYSHSFPCWTIGPLPVTLTVTPGTGTCTVPIGADVQQFAATRSDGQIDPISWSLNESADRISSTGMLSTVAPGGRDVLVTATEGGVSGSVACSIGSTFAFDVPANLEGSFAEVTDQGPTHLTFWNMNSWLVSWTNPVDAGGCSGAPATVTGDEITVTGDSGPLSYFSSASPFSFSRDLEPGTAMYVVTVQADNSCGMSSPGVSIDLAGFGPVITSVSFGGAVASPTITMIGVGFSLAALGAPSSAGCGASGDIFASDGFYLQDETNGWTGGSAPGDCIGFVVTSFSQSQVVFTLGSYYDSSPWFYKLNQGDQFVIGLDGAIYGAVGSVTVKYPL